MLAKDESYNYTYNDFNHCATCVLHKNYNFLAWYSGSGECRDDQSVVIHVNKIGKPLLYSRIILEGKTGNPVLFSDGEDIYLLYSKFEDIEPIRRLADRWKYCSLWVSKINVLEKKDHINIEVSKAAQISDPSQHLLGRCAPIKFGDHIYLPLYNEVEECNVIFKRTLPNSYEKTAEYGGNVIQPTLWVENDLIYSLSRNFTSRCRFSIVHVSSDMHTFNQSSISDIYNHNSSLHVCRVGNDILCVYNDTISRLRKNLTLGIIKRIGGIIVADPILKLDNYGAYPFLSYNNNLLSIAYSNYDRKITQRLLSLATIRSLKRESDRTKS